MSTDHIADIMATIAYWERNGVDYCDAWWALGQSGPCWGGWPQVREYMRRYAARKAHKERKRDELRQAA